MKRILFFVALTFLFCASIALLSVQLYAQKQITVINAGFEKPDSGKVKGWDGKCSDAGWTGQLEDIPGWKTDALDSADFDSGVEATADATNGKYVGFLMGQDTSMYQVCTRRIADGDMIELKVDVKSTYQANKFKMELFYMDGDTGRVAIVSDVKTITGTMATYSISFNASDKLLAVGWKVGILFDNVSDLPNSWVGIDNVRLLNNDPTIIELVNYSFELPDSGKVKGWDGACTDSTWKNLQDIPGWSSDTSSLDSGVELGWTPTEGLYTGFMRASDPAVWQVTNYTIQAGDEIQLRVDGRITWAATTLSMELFYVDNDTVRVPIDSEDEELNATYSEFTISFSANSTPACVGKKLGVLLDNTTPVDASWAGIDNVRLNANHPITAVAGTPSIPTEFSLAQNYPNPFNPSTRIHYSLKNSGLVHLFVYDIIGREVAVLANDIQTAGPHEVTFSGSNVSSGIYFYTLRTSEGSITKKMMLMK